MHTLKWYFLKSLLKKREKVSVSRSSLIKSFNQFNNYHTILIKLLKSLIFFTLLFAFDNSKERIKKCSRVMFFFSSSISCWKKICYSDQKKQDFLLNEIYEKENGILIKMMLIDFLINEIYTNTIKKLRLFVGCNLLNYQTDFGSNGDEMMLSVSFFTQAILYSVAKCKSGKCAKSVLKTFQFTIFGI